jgi:hypothetical protein
MTISQNGWSASSDKSAIGIVSPRAPGIDVAFPQGIRSGDVSTILLYVASEFNKHVEPLRAGQCWGYNYREISGSNSLSNHASGTAVDFNAPTHALGASGTFSGAQVAAIRAILNFCEGAVRWGGDYTGRKDEMHFEINSSASACARVAAKINGNPTTPPPSSGVIKKGDTGESVRQIQRFLLSVFPAYRHDVSVRKGVLLVVDGEFGAQTEAWVKELQKRSGITVDGIVGPATLAKMRSFGFKY